MCRIAVRSIVVALFALASALAAPAARASSWPEFGRDNANTSVSDETWLNTGNANALVEKFYAVLPEAVAGQPVAVRDTVYMGTLGGQVVAYSLTDGHTFWSTQLGSSIYGSVYVRNGRVYTGDLTATAYCLNAQTGAVLWQTPLGDPAFEGIFGSPTFTNNKVVVGIASYVGDNPCSRGRAIALDATTGAIAWTWYNVDASSTGGGVWNSVAADDVQGRVYVATANPCSGNAYSSPYCNAIICLNSATGTELWHYQAIVNDQDDMGFGGSPVLFNANGIPAVAAGNKDGNVYAVRRDTGALLWIAALAGKAGFTGDIGCISTAAVLSDRLIIGCGKTLDGYPGAIYALNVTNGVTRWRHTTTSPVYGPIAAANGVVLACAVNPELLALSAANGDSLFKGTLGLGGGLVFGGPSVSHGYILVPSFDFKVYQYSFAQVPTGVELHEEAAAGDGIALAAAVDRAAGVVHLTAQGVTRDVTATIVDVAGRTVAHVDLRANGSPIATGTWDARTRSGQAVPAGVYLARVAGASARIVVTDR